MEKLDLSAGRQSRASSVSSHDTWNSASGSEDEAGNGKDNRPGRDAQWADIDSADTTLVPESLRPGRPVSSHSSHPTGAAPGLDSQTAWGSQSQQPSDQVTSTNPFLHSPHPPQPDAAAAMQQPNWDDLVDLGHAPQQPVQNRPIDGAPTAELDSLLLGEKNVPHDQPHSLATMPTPQSLLPPTSHYIQPQPTGSGSNNPWQDDLDKRGATQQHNSAPLIDLRIDTAASEWKSQPGHTPISAPPPKLATIASPVSQAKLEAQRHAIYSIKQINWLSDPDSGMRRSPILTQNANGPCPLLALVNALVLSAPPTETNALYDALQAREQITLGLLLDVVFEELVRRNERHGRELPDIDDLYSFLINLHTGMNVNPRFVASDHSTEIVGMYDTSPGTFEQTHDMKLYGTFGLGLVHGWMIPYASDDHKAFERAAQSYDDAQNVQFREEELEEKASATGLSDQEQQMAQDILIIKRVMASYPSQLTEYGLGVITKWMRPGQIAILFRNDHFSTLYKEPRTGTLMSLVTDAGYASHDEIIWESLVDISGSRSQFYSGDFRTVGLTSAGRPTESINDLVQPNGNLNHVSTEQEDHDLALALQLQEEENQREEAAAADRRRHEEELSQQFLAQEGRNSGGGQEPSQSSPTPQLPPRQANAAESVSTPAAPAPSAPLVHNSAQRHDPEQVAPPPTYEQAASDRPYREGDALNALPPQQGDALGALNALSQEQAQQAALQQQRLRPGNPSGRGSHTSAAGFRRSSGYTHAQPARPGVQQNPGSSTYPAYGGPGGTQNLYGRPGNDQEKCTVM